MRKSRCDPATFLPDILPFVNSEGARNLNTISRELSIPYQTLRSRMDRLGEQGLSIRPVIEASKIGLERVRATFRLSHQIADQMQFFTKLNETAGLRYFARAIILQDYDTEFWVPQGKVGELSKLLASLEKEDLVSEVKLCRLVWKDFFMFKARNFDYRSSAWDVNFANLVGDPSVNPPSEEIAIPERFDYNDLFVIKSMEVNPWVKNMDIAKELGISDADVSYHLNEHVLHKKLVSGFRLAWIGKREAWRKHSIIAMTLIFDSISDEMMRHAMSILSAIPFAWNHARGEGGYYLVELIVPIAHYVETMRFISDSFRRLDLRPALFETDSSSVMGYTIPYQMYDRVNRAWSFDREKSLEHILQTVTARTTT